MEREVHDLKEHTALIECLGEAFPPSLTFTKCLLFPGHCTECPGHVSEKAEEAFELERQAQSPWRQSGTLCTPSPLHPRCAFSHLCLDILQVNLEVIRVVPDGHWVFGNSKSHGLPCSEVSWRVRVSTRPGESVQLVPVVGWGLCMSAFPASFRLSWQLAPVPPVPVLSSTPGLCGSLEPVSFHASLQPFPSCWPTISLLNHWNSLPGCPLLPLSPPL